MFWQEHRRRNRPFLVIHHATALSPRATCLFVAVTHGQTVNPIGARRTFFIEEKNSEIRIRSLSIHIEQLTTRKKKKIVCKWVESSLEPKLRGVEQTEQTAKDQKKRMEQQ